MLAFFYGTDSYRVREEMYQFLQRHQVQQSSPVEIFYFDFTEDPITSAASLENAIKHVSLFSNAKALIVKNIFGSGVEHRLEHAIGDTGNGTIIVVTEYLDGKELTKKNKKLFHILTTEAMPIKEILPLTDRELTGWIKDQCHEIGCSIEQAAIPKLIAACSPTTPDKKELEKSRANLPIRLKNELEKLASFSTNRVITSDAIDILMQPEADQQIFPFIDALAERNQAKAFRLLSLALENGVEPHYIFSMIVYQFRNLLVMKDLATAPTPFSELAAQSGLHPYVARKTHEQAKRFEMTELKKKFIKLADIEITSKNGEVDLVDELYNFVLSI